MKATGIVRRVDDLGRIVIPKEIRRKFRIHESEPMELFIDENTGEIIFKKYYLKSLQDDQIIKMIHLLQKDSGYTIAITDLIDILTCTDSNIVGRNIPTNVRNHLETKECFEVSDEPIEKTSTFYIKSTCPLISDGEVIGGLLIISCDDDPVDDDIKRLAKNYANIMNCTILNYT